MSATLSHYARSALATATGRLLPRAAGSSTRLRSVLAGEAPRLAVLGVVCAWLFFFRLGDRDLWSSHEGRAAQNAQSILDGGTWLLPRQFNGRIEMQKPPLYYWLTAGIGWLGGGRVDEWAVRAPAAFSALGCCLLLYFFARSAGRPLAGLLSALVLATMQHFTWMARIGRIDMPLTFAVAAAVLAYHAATDGTRRWPWLTVFYLAMAVAVLLKGPIGVVLTLCAVAVGLLAEGSLPGPLQFRAWLRLGRDSGVVWGVPLLLVVAVPWFAWANTQTQGQLVRSFLHYHNWERAFGGSGGLRAHPWWFYAPRLLADLLPWSPFVLGAVVLVRKLGWARDPLARLGLAWFAGIVVVLSCVRFKRADYLLPAYPGAALFLGAIAESLLAGRWGRYGKAAFATLVAGCLVAWGVLVCYEIPRREPERDQRPFAAKIQQLLPEGTTLVFFRTEAHALAYHLHRSIDMFVEWERLDDRAAKPETHYIVIPPHWAVEWPQHLHRGHLEAVLDNRELAGGLHEQPLLLMRTRGSTSKHQ